MPVGFKNGTDGGVQIAIDALRAAAHPHRFLGVTEQGLAGIVSTRGNPDCHVILRGGATRPELRREQRAEDAGRAARRRRCRRGVMIDASHGNSEKDYRRQPVVVREVAAQVAEGETRHHRRDDGELPRRRPPGPRATARRLVYGQSITDACMGWDTTVPVLHELAAAVRARRRSSPLIR